MRPFLIVIAGPNGSGKSTLTRRLMREGFDLGYYINPDDIAASLMGSYAQRVAAAQAQADAERALCLIDGKSFSFETVMSHPSKLDVMRAARAAGFRVTLLFVSIADPIINIARVRSRVVAGGHDVPADRIVARWERTSRLLADAVLCCDSATIFDNTLVAADLVQSFEAGFVSGLEPTLQPVAQISNTAKLLTVQLAEKIPEWLVRYLLAPLQSRAPEFAQGGQSLLIRQMSDQH